MQWLLNDSTKGAFKNWPACCFLISVLFIWVCSVGDQSSKCKHGTCALFCMLYFKKKLAFCLDKIDTIDLKKEKSSYNQKIQISFRDNHSQYFCIDTARSFFHTYKHTLYRSGTIYMAFESPIFSLDNILPNRSTSIDYHCYY